jgi:hypothetical protein
MILIYNPSYKKIKKQETKQRAKEREKKTRLEKK